MEGVTSAAVKAMVPYGPFAVLFVLSLIVFGLLIWWVLKTSREREERLLEIITKYNTELARLTDRVDNLCQWAVRPEK